VGKKQERIVRRQDRKNLVDNPTSDQLKVAQNEALKLVALHEGPTKKGALSEHPLLPGVTKTSGEYIQQIVLMRIGGFRDVAIAEQIGTSQPNISRLEKNHPHAFIKAEIHALEHLKRKSLVNLESCRLLLSEAGPRLVKVLVELAENEDVKDNVRKDCAIAGLNLMGAGHARTTVGGRDSELTKVAQNVFIQSVQDQEKKYEETVVIEAEDAEIVEEEDS
jgi:hypothetical protein